VVSQIAVIGLGYVGLSLAAGLARHYPVVGYDIDAERVAQLRTGVDRNAMLEIVDLTNPSLQFTDDPELLAPCDFFVVSVPTPVNPANEPDLSPLRSACQMVGKTLQRGATVVFESTVYPGCTEEECIPVLEQASGLTHGVDFTVGYSPERIDPGNTSHTLESVMKIVAGSDQATTELMAGVYGKVVAAGIHKAESIRIAEAAKVIENVQRDLNIALMNEFTVLFHRLDLDPGAVFDAARTKWNFLPYHPGLVGGHCIPVDPYYLIHKAQEVGFHTELIAAARRVNDRMGAYVASEAIKRLVSAGKQVTESKALVLGLTFKEDVRDIRNSQVFGLIDELESFGLETWVHDPLVTVPGLAERMVSDPFAQTGAFDLVVLAVPHEEYRERGVEDFLSLCNNETGPGMLVDVRGVYRGLVPGDSVAGYWSL
jgi:UDP-N-acetyl-D-galactosamine dehydrogenase